MSKVFVGMSGGVDSSVAALLLKEQGHDVTGIYMKNWSQDMPGMKCPWAEDLADAKRVAVRLGIDFQVWDYEEEYREKVVEYMLREFKAGNTPNPDIMCNQEIKFKLFYKKARQEGADFIATGHYARVENAGTETLSRAAGNTKIEPPTEAAKSLKTTKNTDPLRSPTTPKLLKAVDKSKDQTYFLYRISDEALSHTLFPIGGMIKKDVKKLAAERGLHNAYKKESMGVCFVGEVGMKEFLSSYIEAEPGEIREIETGKILGHHDGAVFYTVGQRHGLYLSGVPGETNSGMPYYVVKKDLIHNIIYVSRNLNNENLWAEELKLKDVILRGGVEISPEENIEVRLRHLAPMMTARFIMNEANRTSNHSNMNEIDGLNDTAGGTLKFAQKIKRPAAGQSAVFYRGEECLGGGIIV